MIIKTSFAEMQRALGVVTPVVSDKLLQEDLRNITIWKNGDVLNVVANNAFVSTMTKFDATFTYATDEEPVDEMFIQFKASEIKNILATYSGLHLTVVSALVFDVRQAEIRVEVHEEAADKNVEGSEKFSKIARHRMQRVRVGENIKREIHQFKDVMNEPEASINLNTKEVLGYIEALLPAISKIPNDTPFTRMYVMSDNMYVIPQTYAAIIENRLDDEVKAQFSKFVLTCSVATFLKSFLSLADSIEFRKKIIGDLVLLIFKNGDTMATVRAYSDKRVPNISEYNIQPENSISIDRLYFADVIKRINNSGNDATFKIVIDEAGVSTCTVMNKVMTQEIPIYKAKGVGEFTFTIKADLLPSITFNNMLDCFGNRLAFRIDEDDNGKINFYVDDNTKGWHTKMKGLTLVKTDLQQWD